MLAPKEGTTYYCTVEGCCIGDCPNCLYVAQLESDVQGARAWARVWKRKATRYRQSFWRRTDQWMALRLMLSRLATDTVEEVKR
jgi:hypothetical protein